MTYCYLAGIPDDDGMWSELQMVIAGSDEAAARLAFPSFDDEQIAEVLAKEDEYEVRRYELGDTLILADNTPRVIRDMDVMRSVGIRDEGDRECESCGEWGPNVCGTCDRCEDPECRDADEPCPDCDILPMDDEVKVIEDDGEPD